MTVNQPCIDVQGPFGFVTGCQFFHAEGEQDIDFD